MRALSESTSNGVTTREFVHNDVPGVLWSPSDSPAGSSDAEPVVLLAHGGGQHKKAPGIEARARGVVRACGFTALTLDAPGHGDRPRTARDEQFIAEIRGRATAGEPVLDLIGTYVAELAAQAVPEWRTVLDALGFAGPVGFCGMSMGSMIGIRLVAAEPRITAAVFGVTGGVALHEAAARVRVPVRFLMQWDDQLVPRDEALALFGAFGSAVKSLHANPGGHGEVPEEEEESAYRFFRRHLTGRRSPENTTT